MSETVLLDGKCGKALQNAAGISWDGVRNWYGMSVELAEALAAEREKREAAERESSMYRLLFDDALDHVDSVFQASSANPAPLLPDFLSVGESKFAGVVAGLYWFGRHPKPDTTAPAPHGPRRSLRWRTLDAERN